MLTAISLQNFKCYKDKTKFPLSKINLLTGINGKGKSTFLQSILLFKQTVEHNSAASSLLLNGNYVRLGTFQDVKNAETSQNKPILVEFEFDANIKYIMPYNIRQDENGEDEYDDFAEYEKGNFKLSYDLFMQEGQVFELFIDKIQVDSINIDFIIGEDKNKVIFEQRKYEEAYTGDFDIKRSYKPGPKSLKDVSDLLGGLTIGHPNVQEKPDLSLLNLLPQYTIKTEETKKFEDNFKTHKLLNFSKIHFVSADRLGPQEYYPKHSLSNFLEVGKQGQKTLDVLAKIKNQVLSISDARIINEGNNILSLTGEWLSYILDTNVSLLIDTDSAYISTLKFRFNDKEYTPPNVGFGYSYILPIIVAGLVAKEGEILIIENPEAHLHPRAQSHLANFLAKVASMGVQVFIESHSEHILNGIRIAAVEREGSPKILAHTDISILYFQQSEEATFVQIPVEKDGKIRNWPNGFFDQLEKDTEILYGL